MQIFKKKSLFEFFVKMVAFFMVVILVSQVCSFFSDCLLNEGFLYSYEDKLETLKNTKEKKTVFVGGSSVLFGVSAERYEKLSGQKSVNMGLNAGAYDLYLSTIKPYINKDDVVVLAFEFEAYTQQWYTFSNIVLDLAHISKSYYKEVPLRYKGGYLYKQTLRYYEKSYNVVPQFIKKVLNDEELYKRKNINEYGDMKRALIAKKDNLAEAKKIKTQINNDSLNEILRHIKEIENKGAKVYVCYPPCYVSDDNGSMDEFDKQIRNVFGDRVLGNIDDWLCENDDYFFDTVYHLNDVGVIKHTEYYYDLIKQAEEKK